MGFSFTLIKSFLFVILMETKSKKLVSYNFFSIMFKSFSDKSSLSETFANIFIVSDEILLFPTISISVTISALGNEVKVK